MEGAKMIDYRYEVGKNIAELRRSRHITQEQLAEILDISVKHCSEVERGIAFLSFDKLLLTSDFFDCTLDYLVYGVNTSDTIAAIPKHIIEILKSDNEYEKQLLLRYLNMYYLLRETNKTEN